MADDDTNTGGDQAQDTQDAGRSSYTPPASQADLDRIIADRLARERAKYADYDALRAKAAEHDKAVEAARSEHEKAVEAAKAEGRTEALTVANARLVAAEARAAAAEARFRNPGLAVKALDLTAVTVGDDGAVDGDAIRQQLTALADAEPYLLDTGPNRPRPDPHQGGSSSGARATGVDAGRALFESRRKPATTGN